ncbi:MAG: hypothetical protein WC682_04105 [Parcubacteria group bacterium]|jgi:hypothetical protein
MVETTSSLPLEVSLLGELKVMISSLKGSALSQQEKSLSKNELTEIGTEKFLYSLTEFTLDDLVNDRERIIALQLSLKSALEMIDQLKRELLIKETSLNNYRNIFEEIKKESIALDDISRALQKYSRK